jgi:hypothetical protein
MKCKFFFACTVYALLAPQAAFAQFAELASKVHAGSNAIVAIDVEAVEATPLAKKSGWTKRLHEAYMQSAVFLPPEANQLVIASHLLPGEGFRQAWEVAVMTLSEPPSMQTIARAEGGYVDKISGVDAVWSPSGAYLLKLGPSMMGVVAPPYRQAVARWITEMKEKRSGQLSPYLNAAIRKVSTGPQIVMAIDLKDSVPPHRINDGLNSEDFLNRTKIKPEKVKVLSGLLASIQGATIEISIGQQATARTHIDFGQRLFLTSDLAKTLVLGALKNLGAELPELEKHKFTATGTSIQIEGTLTATSLRRLFSVLEVPTTKFSSLKHATPAATENKQPSASDMAKNSQKYFKSVNTLVDDLRGDRKKQDPRGGGDAVWMERYARKIDRLPILFVDKDLLEYGSKTAETLRIMSGARKNAGLREGYQKSEISGSQAVDGYGYAWNGSYSNYRYGYGGAFDLTADARNAQAARNRIHRQEQNVATSRKVEGWRLIDNATADMRRVMTARYSIEF